MMKMMMMLVRRMMRKMMAKGMMMMRMMKLKEALGRGQLRMTMMKMRMMLEQRSRKLMIRSFPPAESFLNPPLPHLSVGVMGAESKMWSSSSRVLASVRAHTHPTANFLESTKTSRLYLLNEIL